MVMKFINRENEIMALKKELGKRNSFIVIYGRRRIGKTELVKQAIKEENNKIYLLCEEGYRINLLHLQTIVKEISDMDIGFNRYLDFFKYLKSTNKRWVVVLDEFQNIIEKREILSEFQIIVDEVVRNSNIHLIILGSSTHIMRSFLEYKSPLYGRRNLSINVKELNFMDILKFNKLSVEENVKIYGITGGVPQYIKIFSSFEDVKNIAFSKNGFLYEEIEFIMGSEFKEYRVYKLILDAISKGMIRFNEISNYTGIPKTNLYIYLESLMKVGFIKKEVPITKSHKTKNSIYFIKDNYLNFYFTFIEKYKPLIEMDEKIDFISFEKEYNQYLGKIFENIARKYIAHFKPIKFTQIGRWWYKDKEVDLVAINPHTKEMLCVEVKWQELKLKEVKKIIDKLYETLPYIEWHNNKRKAILGIFAKTIDKKAKDWLLSQGHLAWDLSDIEKIREL